MVELIEPGGYDQNFPSYETSLAFYDILASSFTFSFGEPPSYLRSASQAGKEIAYDAAGRHRKYLSRDCQAKSLYLGYGLGDFREIIESIIAKQVAADQDVAWKRGAAVLPQYKEAPWWNSHQVSDYKTLDKKILGIDERPQLIVLGGFLGSGKTTFLQHFIEYQVQMNRFVAIIQNEIGETGLDGKLLDQDYALTEIDEGCVCCTLVGKRLLDRSRLIFFASKGSSISARGNPPCFFNTSGGVLNCPGLIIRKCRKDFSS